MGVEIVEKPIRTYVSGDVASHLIGTIGPMYANEVDYYKSIEDADYEQNDTVGKSGVEKAFEHELRGKNGEMHVVKNSRGDVIDVIETIAPVAGNTVQLTIDYNFQKEVQQLVSDYILKFNETNNYDKKIPAASVVVLDAKAGGLLASVSYPYYNNADYYENPSSVANSEGQPVFNRALNGIYRPGSTFKPITAIGALTDGVIETDTQIICTGRYTGIPGWKNPPGCLNDKHRPGESLDTITALKYSCNIFFYDAGLMMGIDQMEKYTNLFGLGVDTGLELPHEKGFISSPERSEQLGSTWQLGNVVQAAIGQLDTQVTPLQMAVEAMTIANRGTRYNTHILKGVSNYSQTELLQDEQITIASEFDTTDEIFDVVIEGMVAAASTMGAPNQVTDLGYPVAIKTGTPQVSLTKTNSTFVAFAPADNPEIAIACVIEDGYNSRALLRSILEAYEKTKTNVPN